MRCQELEKYAIPYVDGGLGGREHGEVEQHLRECAACAERLQGFAEVNARLGEWEEIRPSASFDARLEQRIAAQRAASRSWWERFVYGLMPFHKPVLAGGVAANSTLRERLTREGEEHGIRVYFPPLNLCLDNAAMIAGLAFHLKNERR